MSVTEVRGDASSSAKEKNVDLKLEVVVIPVSDVDRAKEVYSKLGWGSMPTSLSITRCTGRPVQRLGAGRRAIGPLVTSS